MKFLSSQIEEMIRVNHAGEMGAKVIYDGQIAALRLKKDKETLKLVEEMRVQEVEHFDFFDAEIIRQKLRPTLMQPVWKVGGFALGFLTAIIDKKAAMLCTAAVEEVIDEHYQDQIRTLKKHLKRQEQSFEKNFKGVNGVKSADVNQSLGDAKKIGGNLALLCQKIKKFRDDEIAHKNTAYEQCAQDFVMSGPLSWFIKTTTKLAIAVSKKI